VAPGGDLVSATDADGHVFHYRYHEGHLLAEDTDRTGLTFHFVYDLKRRGVASWGEYSGQRDPSLASEPPMFLADGTTRWRGIHHCRLHDWDIGFTEVTDFSQHQRFYGNEHGTLDKRVIGGGVMTASYREDGALLSRTNERSGTEHFERSARGSVLAYTDPLGNITTITRDANDLPIAIVDPKGGTHTLERDARGNVTLEVDPAGGITSRRYDARGLVVEEISPRGERAVFAYDAHGNLVEATLATGATFRYRYDALGRRLAEIDPFGAETRYRWSPRGDLVEATNALGGTTRYNYDGEHHLTAIIDPNGAVTSLAWGGYHKLCLRRDANGSEVRIGYSPEGELIEVQNERGERHRIERDPAGRVYREVTFDGRRTSYRHDHAGDIIARETETGRALFTYDVMGRLVKRELPDETEEAFEYDAVGDLVRAEGPFGEITLTRDPLGRVVREAQRLWGVEHRVDVAYDPEGERVLRKTSLGHTEQVERGPLGARRRTVLDGGGAVEHTSDLLGREVVRALPGGGRLESAYDRLGRLERRRALGVGQVWPLAQLAQGEPAWVGQRPERVTADTAYRYDPAGELIGTWDKARGQTAFQYDPVGQLLARLPEQARPEVFRYDPAGNLFEGVRAEGARTYEAGNRLVQRGDTSYRWDRDGRLVEKRISDAATGQDRIWSYAWNGAGLLESVCTPSGVQVVFAYDPLGRRTSKELRRAARPGEPTRPYARTRFVWDGDVLVHEVSERARAGQPVVEVKTYCFEDDGFSPVAHRDAGGWFHDVNDSIGTPERLVGEDGVVACELRREAWGRTEVAPGGKTETALRFPGQYEDTETGLCYNRFRYYDPEAVRFISSDPIGLGGGENVFAAPVNLTRWIDPLGLAATTSRKGAIEMAMLPTSGRVRYVPPKNWSPPSPLPRGERGGYRDKFGNEWVKGPSRTCGEPFEWDVQLSRTGAAQLGWASREGAHLNVSMKGHITH
jgi:RHS repeat-associated protein